MRAEAWLFVAGLSGALAIVAGAFGAHGLRGRIDAGLLAAFETGAHYHLVHSVALFALALALKAHPAWNLGPAAWAWLVGIALFSGSLYVMALTGIRPFGAITPFGGLAFIAGWAWAGWVGLRATLAT